MYVFQLILIIIITVSGFISTSVFAKNRYIYTDMCARYLSDNQKETEQLDILFSAIENHNHYAIRKALESKPVLNAAKVYDDEPYRIMPPLHAAVYTGDPHTVELLIKQVHHPMILLVHVQSEDLKLNIKDRWASHYLTAFDYLAYQEHISDTDIRLMVKSFIDAFAFTASLPPSSSPSDTYLRPPPLSYIIDRNSIDLMDENTYRYSITSMRGPYILKITNAFAHAVMTRNVVMAEAILEQLEKHAELSETLEKIRNDFNESPFISSIDIFFFIEDLVSHPIETIQEEQIRRRISRQYAWMARQLAERQALRSVTEDEQSTADLAD